VNIRKTRKNDRIEVAGIYRTAWQGTEGIARRPNEITETYIFSLLNKNDSQIVSLVAEDDKGEIVGVIHALKDGLESHDHLLSDLTIIVHPDHQKTGVAKALGWAFLQHISENRPDILRVEMHTPDHDYRVKAFQSGGFEVEGKLNRRLRNPDGSFQDVVVMTWINPNFNPKLKGSK